MEFMRSSIRGERQANTRKVQRFRVTSPAASRSCDLITSRETNDTQLEIAMWLWDHMLLDRKPTISDAASNSFRISDAFNYITTSYLRIIAPQQVQTV